jgi:spore maturation protein CgeB
MRILHANCLHQGEWESYWPEARRELLTTGRLEHHFPRDHNGAWLWSRVLRDIGHEVHEFDYRSTYLISKELRVRFPILHDMFGSTTSRTSTMSRKLPWITKWDIRMMNKRLLELARSVRPDIFLTSPGEKIFPDTIREMQRKLGIRTVLWLERDPVFEATPNVVESFPYYDFVFTIDPPMVEQYQRLGAKRVYYLPVGCYPPLHRRLELSESERASYSAAVSFVGTLFDRRPEFLSGLVDLGISFWTHSWDRQLQERHPELTPHYRGSARGPAMLKVLNGADVVINVHRFYNSIEGTNMRTFEAAGCGAFQITEYRKELERMFKIGEELEVFYDVDDLKRKVKYYLAHPEERVEMGERAQKRVYAEHTYQQRFEEMFQLVKG